ncbi:hypothetical protein Agub_g3903 [Astrephomene gubernaculifera]|uniref:Major facilitator superfamily (MFS) profile domain-containing protein n=1 Tax=Astrephomene gubernaculifera TaxID=47775 RepID=A0AAD3HJB0_9CHLO|nr:hypothetical protein Agub_g3903 [Astrephomene gubernaculifera]
MASRGTMRSSALHGRPLFGGAPRRAWVPSVRPRVCTWVIVPSRDSASESSGKRVPLLWTYSDDLSGLGELQQQKEVLEEVYQRGAAATTTSTTSTSTISPAVTSPSLAAAAAPATRSSSNAATGVPTGAGEEDEEQAVGLMAVSDPVVLDPALLSERLSSSALASTSAPSFAAAAALQSSACEASQQLHSQRSSHHHHLASTASSSSTLSQPPVTQQRHSSSPAGQKSTADCLSSSISSSNVMEQAAPSHGSPQAAAPQHLSRHDATKPTTTAAAVQPAAVVATTAEAAAATSGAAAPVGSSSSSDHSTSTTIPGSIWILCCISAALTCASCVFNTALPIYMVSELKMSMKSMGMFEGLLEAFSYIVRMCSGVVSDRMTSRKAAITLGFAAGAAAKFGMAGAGTVGLLFGGKAIDRLANGIQAAPRDALIGDLSPPTVRSACFGLAQSLRKWGSAVGALAAFTLMKASNNNYQLIFYSAATVSLLATLAFVVFVPAHERVVEAKQAPTQAAAGSDAAVSSSPSASSSSSSGVAGFLRSVVSMGSDFYRMLGVICLYAMGHVNESLLEARAMEVGFGKAEATLVVAALAGVTFLTAFPLGKLDDKYGPGTTFAVGISALIAGDLVLLAAGSHPLALFAACGFLGVHWAVIQGPLLSIVSGLAPSHLRGTAFGIFYTVMAVTAVAANTMYGSIWHMYGANAAFMTSAALMTVVLTALPYMLPPSALAASRRLGGAGTAAASAAPVSAPAVTATILPAAA